MISYDCLNEKRSEISVESWVSYRTVLSSSLSLSLSCDRRQEKHSLSLSLSTNHRLINSFTAPFTSHKERNGTVNCHQQRDSSDSTRLGLFILNIFLKSFMLSHDREELCQIEEWRHFANVIDTFFVCGEATCVFTIVSPLTRTQDQLKFQNSKDPGNIDDIFSWLTWRNATCFLWYIRYVWRFNDFLTTLKLQFSCLTRERRKQMWTMKLTMFFTRFYCSPS